MAASLRHRGPDDDGGWVDERAGIALAHRRLAIIDVGPSGHQPMASATGRFQITFNGEIYNYQALREALESIGATVHGRSDTAVLLAGFEAWGIAGTLARIVGQFAFGVWDAQKETLHLARDRLGEKPLYYGLVGGAWAFGSELRVFPAHPEFRPVIDREALALYVRYGYVPSPHAIYEGVRKLPPGTWLSLGRNAGSAPEPSPYWTAHEAIEAGRSSRVGGADGHRSEGIEAVLRTAVREALVADVPVGVFLSGGIDSSLVTALVKEEAAGPVDTFTVGFDDAAFDESGYADAIARHLGTRHHAFRLTPAQAQECARDIAARYDEPFADSSQVPTFLVARFARERVKVCLSGDGGDEAFGGYNRYSQAAAAWRRVAPWPRWMRAWLAAALRLVPSVAWDASMAQGAHAFPQGRRSDRVRKFLQILSAGDEGEAYRRLVSVWQDPGRIVMGGREPPVPGLPSPQAPLEERMMEADLTGYLPGDVLTKVDRATMAVGLESRSPFLNHHVVQAAWGLPLDAKIRGGKGKLVLRDLLGRRVPKELFERPKMGFALPLADWLRGPLREWAEPLLDGDRLRAEGHFHPEPIRKAWKEHLRGRRSRANELWAILMFQAWFEAQRRRGVRFPMPAERPRSVVP